MRAALRNSQLIAALSKYNAACDASERSLVITISAFGDISLRSIRHLETARDAYQKLQKDMTGRLIWKARRSKYPFEQQTASRCLRE